VGAPAAAKAIVEAAPNAGLKPGSSTAATRDCGRAKDHSSTTDDGMHRGRAALQRRVSGQERFPRFSAGGIGRRRYFVPSQMPDNASPKSTSTTNNSLNTHSRKKGRKAKN